MACPARRDRPSCPAGVRGHRLDHRGWCRAGASTSPSAGDMWPSVARRRGRPGGSRCRVIRHAGGLNRHVALVGPDCVFTGGSGREPARRRRCSHPHHRSPSTASSRPEISSNWNTMAASCASTIALHVGGAEVVGLPLTGRNCLAASAIPAVLDQWDRHRSSTRAGTSSRGRHPGDVVVLRRSPVSSLIGVEGRDAAHPLRSWAVAFEGRGRRGHQRSRRAPRPSPGDAA